MWAAADYHSSWAAGIHVQCSHATSTFINLRVIMTRYFIPGMHSAALMKLWWAPGPRCMLYGRLEWAVVVPGVSSIRFAGKSTPKAAICYACSRSVTVINTRCVIT
jgi:hypothetical protein